MVKFNYYTIKTLFYSLDWVIAAKLKFIWAYIRAKWGGVVRTISLPVHADGSEK